MEASTLRYRALVEFCSSLLWGVRRDDVIELEIFHQTQLHYLLRTSENFTLEWHEEKPNQLVLKSATVRVVYHDHATPELRHLIISVS